MIMSPLTPLTVVKVCKNVPLDSTYTDTLDFSSVSAQVAYFNTKTKYTFSNLTPVRLQNAIRLEKNADYFYDCNYIAFQNSNFGNKWFYAFITKIEFMNVNMTHIEYEIDVIQTWFFDITLKQSFVEREHSLLDNIGYNLVPEPVELTDYVLEPASKTPYFNSYSAVIQSALAKNATDTSIGGYFGGMFSGLNYSLADLSSDFEVENLLTYLKGVTDANNANAIAATYIMPTAFATREDKSPTVVKPFTLQKQYGAIGDYTPRNKKLYTYPYNFLLVSSTSGGTKTFRYEYFKNPTLEFILMCAMGANPEVVCYPKDYNNQAHNIDECLTLSGFPQFAFSIDTYKAWLAQNNNSQFISYLSSALTLAGGLATLNPIAAAGGAIGLGQTAANEARAQNASDTTKGAQGCSTLTATKDMNFYFYNKHLREDNLQRIDTFFTMYGYAIQQMKLPNITSRPSFNYIKTRELKAVGSVPFDDMAKFKQCFNNGITFWHGDYVGEYNRPNEV